MTAPFPNTAAEDGRSPSGRATHERSQSPLSSPSVGIPNAALLQGERYSPNLRKWVNARRHRVSRLSVYRNDSDAFMGGNLYIGQLFDDGWFHGSQLNQALCNGSKAESWAFSPAQLSLTEIEDFWERYAQIGRCAIDEAHDRHFIGEEARWETESTVRRCLWCGNHEQRLMRWTETVERERWEPASGTSGSAQDAQRLDPKGAGPTRKAGDAQ